MIVVVFDIDDTLYLERDYCRSGFSAVSAHVRERFGRDGFASAAWQLFLSGARGDIFDRALGAIGLAAEPDLVRDLVGVYRAHDPDVRLLSDARAALDSMRAAGVSMAAITDGASESQHNKIRALGLSAWLRPIVVTADLGAGCSKPSTVAFEAVRASLGASAGLCVYIADNPAKDFVAPCRLGWRRIRVRRPGALHSASPSGPDVEREVPDLRDLGSVLSRLGLDHQVC